jgi:hypothetical protein
MDSDPADILTHDLAFAGVDAGADIESERADCVRYSARAANSARRAIEGREKSVAGCIDLTPSKAAELTTDDFMVAVE